MNLDNLGKILTIDYLPPGALPVYDGLAEEVLSPALVTSSDGLIHLGPVSWEQVVLFIALQFVGATNGKHDCPLSEELVSAFGLDPAFQYYHASKGHCGLISVLQEPGLFGVFVCKNTFAKTPKK